MWRVKNSIGYGSLVILIFAGYVYFGNYNLFLFFWFLISFLFVSVLSVYYMKKGLTARFHSRMVQAGKNVEQSIQFQIENKSWLPILYINVQLTVQNYFYDSEKIEVQCSVLGKSKKNIVIPITFRKSGCVELGISKMIIRDWMQIFEKEIPIGCTEELIVMPDVNETTLLQSVFSSDGEREEDKIFAEEPSDSIASVREYRNGDRMQQIHWKLSAKKEKIFVKEYENISKENVKILLELSKDDNGSLDACIDMVYSLAKAFIIWQQPVCLLWWSGEREDFQEKVVESEELLEQAIYEIFYERTYEERNKAYFLMSQDETYFYIQPYGEGLDCYGETICTYRDRAMLTKILSYL